MQVHDFSIVTYVLWGSLLLAVLTIITSELVLLQNRLGLSIRMGLPGWDFSQSWASNFTGAGMIINLLLSSQILPKQPDDHLKQTYSCLAVFFATLIIVAPFLYNLFRTPVKVQSNPQKPEKFDLQYQGYAWAFLLASVATLWGALGQLVTIIFLFEEIRGLDFIPGSAIRLLQILLVIVSGSLLFHAGLTVWSTVKSQKDHETQGQKALFSALGEKSTHLSEEEKDKLKMPQLKWPLL